MVNSRAQHCAGAMADEAGARDSAAGRDRREWDKRASASAPMFAGLPYFPFRLDTPEPLTLALLGAAFLMICWRICRRS